jgi:tetratricopeptide (TPR) repeat protein
VRLAPNNARYKENLEKARAAVAAERRAAEKVAADKAAAERAGNRGQEYIDLKAWDQAIPHFTEAIRLDPNNAVYYNQRAVAYSWAGKMVQAIEDMIEAIRLKPNKALYYHNRGNLYYATRDYNRAIADYTEAVRLDPNNSTYKKSLEDVRKARG